ncbi:MAG: thioesterase family protein [Candidatus Dormibacteria bacterium]
MSAERGRRDTLLAEADGLRTGPGKLEPGETFEFSRTVSEEMSARHLGSGTVGVLATPAMVSMMEGASMQCAQPYLEAVQTTVGYVVNIRHLAPTPIGAEVRARATVTNVTERKITYQVSCFEGERKVGDGEHVRVVITSDAFLSGASGKT